MLSKFLQNQEHMRLNIGKKLKIASLNSRFTGSKQEECASTCSILKVLKPKDLELLLTYKIILQQPQGRFRSLKKIIVWKKLFLFLIYSKI